MLGETGLEPTLAAGVVDADGARHRRARVRPPTGREEAWLDDEGWEPGDPAGDVAVDEVLSAVVVRLGGYAGAEVTPGLLGALTRGDRRRLLLAVRALLEGDELRLAVRCPSPDCPEVAEVVLSVADLLGAEPLTPAPDAARVATPDGDLLVHLPRAVDDRDARARAATLGPGPQRAAHAWAALVERVDGGADGEGPDGVPDGVPLAPHEWADLSPATRTAVAEALATLLEDAGPETALVARCPRCAAWIELEPDPAELLAAALRAGAARLPAEVHALAYHYGWSEAAVLDLPRERRHRYLDLLVRELEGRPLTGAGGWLG